jgi:MerR family mercuric resistance operon transcriptional regulator
VETIRYYQRSGLLAQPHKSPTGHRRYPRELNKRVRFIKRAQVLGFTLEEIAGLLRLEEARACAETRNLAQRKLQVIEGKLVDLEAMRNAPASAGCGLRAGPDVRLFAQPILVWRGLCSRPMIHGQHKFTRCALALRHTCAVVARSLRGLFGLAGLFDDLPIGAGKGRPCCANGQSADECDQ